MFGSYFVFIAIGLCCLHLAQGQQCPYGWYGYSTNSQCYKFVRTSKLSWQDARSYCQLHGSDLLKINSVNEKNWIYRQVKSIASHNHVSPSNWWTGLNDMEYINTWEWADGTPVKPANLINWKPGEPNNAQQDEKCGEIMYGNSFNDETCADKDYFICSRDRGIPLRCNADRGWQSLNGQCYKAYGNKRTWNQALRQCDHDGGALAIVDSEAVENAFHDMAVNAKQSLWIGVHSLKTGTTTNSWTITNGSALTLTGYWHGGKAPRVDRNHLNTTCVAISNTFPALQGWASSVCTSPRGFICQKPEGVCLPGWIGHRGNCYQFDTLYRQSFNKATQYCQSQGSELMRISTPSEEAFLLSYLDEMRDSGVTSFWIGLSDNNQDAGPFKWRNGQTVATNLKTNWATSNHIPRNTKDKQDCVYISTNDKAAKWRTTTSCTSARAFVCKVPMGRSIKIPPTTPRPHFGCPSGWKLHKDTCFRLYDRATNQVSARTRCQTASTGADLAKIISSDMQSFVNRLIKNHGVAYYIGVNDITTPNTYVWNDETTPITYTNWKRGEPNSHGSSKNCIVLLNNQWSSASCTERHMYICSLVANSAFVPISTTPKMDWTVKCGVGWESNPVTDSCYQFVDTPRTWTDARLQCQVNHGDLVAIETLSEQNYLAGRISSMGSIVVWTGANDRRTEGGWNWVSKAPFAFLNWAPGQPGGRRGGGTDCVAMFTSNAQWDDVNCNTRNGFICEKKGNVPTTPPPTTKPVVIPAGKVLGCPLGWLPFGTNCYRVVKQSSTWSRASQICANMRSSLVSILSQAEQNFIVGNIPKAKLKNSTDGYWTGFNDQQVDMTFVWTDGSTPTYTKWGVNEPNNWMNRNEDCVEIKLATGKWNDEICTSIKQGLICKRAKYPVSATQAPYQAGCKTYHRGYGPYCYSLSGKMLSWTAAEASCKNGLHGTLATINDRFLQAFISSWLYNRYGNFWVGISDNAKNGTWVDGSQIQYTNWDRNHTGNEAATCIAMKASLPVGFWTNLQCSQRAFYVCQYQRTGYTLPPVPTPYPNVPCPTGWTANGGSCYKVFNPTVPTKNNWNQAEGFCSSIGGHLASFHVENNDTFLTTLLTGQPQGQYFIGLNDKDTEGSHKWTDGSAVDYTNWNPGEPNDFAHREDCVVYVTYSKGWNDVGCYTQAPFICMIARGAQIQTTPAPPMAVTSSQCGSGWIYYNGSCYMLNPTSGPNSTLSWYDAGSYCQDHGATLASFHGPDEIAALLGAIAQIKGYNAYNMWIGFNILGGSAYRWTDGTPVDFTNWNPNEPNDYGGVERCAEMTKRGKWNDDQCNLPRAYICRKPLNGQVTPSVPAPYPSGGCQNGFTQAPGGRNKCFYVGGVQPNTQKSFNDAVTFCRQFGPGYDIASIEDLFEQEFVITMAYGKRNSLWIGLQDRRGNNKFYWQDNSPVVYTNWDHNEPTSGIKSSSQKNVQNCVIMRLYKNHEGRWADLDCHTPRGFICQSRQNPSAPVIKGSNNCPQHYVQYRQACYKISSQRLPWNNANDDCKNDGGNLASILDVFEKAFVLVQGSKITPFWIGLSDSFTPGLYGWSDGYPVLYSNWGWSEPSYGQLDSNQNNHGCVFVNRNGRWNDSDCGTPLKYVCKITEATPPPSIAPTYGNCSIPQAIASGDNCYYISVNTGRSWPESNFACQRMGMQLASIHSEGEMQFVFHLTSQAKLTNPKYRPNIWLGMSKGLDGAFRWTDGSAVNYLSWSVGEPSTIGKNGNQEECIEYDRNSGSWNDVGCMSNRGFVCKSLKPTAPVGLSGSSSASPGLPGSSSASTGLPGSFQPINLGGSTVRPPNFSTYRQNTDSIGARTGKGGSKLPPVSYPNQVVSGQPAGVTSGPLQQSGQNTNSNYGLTSGGIAGVVIGCVLIILVIAFIVFYLKRTGFIKPPPLSGSESLGFDNALYNRGDDSVRIDSDA